MAIETVEAVGCGYPDKAVFVFGESAYRAIAQSLARGEVLKGISDQLRARAQNWKQQQSEQNPNKDSPVRY